MVNGQKVVKGQRLTAEQCKQIDAVEQKKALDWVDRNVKVTLTEPQKSVSHRSVRGTSALLSASHPPLQKLNAGDRIGACREIRRWIYDRGRDCRIRSNNCYGQIVRRDQEAELACWGLDK